MDKNYNKEYPFKCLECGHRGCNDLNYCEDCGSEEYIKVYDAE